LTRCIQKISGIVCGHGRIFFDLLNLFANIGHVSENFRVFCYLYFRKNILPKYGKASLTIPKAYSNVVDIYHHKKRIFDIAGRVGGVPKSGNVS
jgi:hypothetical protein